MAITKKLCSDCGRNWRHLRIYQERMICYRCYVEARMGIGQKERRLMEHRSDLKKVYKYVKRCKTCSKEYGLDFEHEYKNPGVCPICVGNVVIRGNGSWR